MDGKWIWLGGEEHENQRGCFAAEFTVPDDTADCVLEIAAVTRYALFLNGEFLGRGPIRSGRGTAYFDTYDLASLLHSGKNYLAIEVWSYGWSTYQTLCENGGLRFAVKSAGRVLLSSGEETRCHLDEGFLSYAPKRNVNLGFTDYYDGRLFSQRWIQDPAETAAWPFAALCPQGDKALLPRPILSYNYQDLTPQHVVRVQDMYCGCQQLTVNVREAFYGDRRDADETVFSGLIGCRILAPRAMSGRVSFPNRTWNGILGNFRLGSRVYPVTDAHRELDVELQEGENLFLLHAFGDFDDLYCHLEFSFPEKLTFVGLGTDECFFTMGPLKTMYCTIDGKSSAVRAITDDREAKTAAEVLLDYPDFAALTSSGAALTWVAGRYVMPESYILSIERMAKIAADYAVKPEHRGILWNNGECSVLGVPEAGDYRRMIVDFGDIYVGTLSFTLFAPEGTVLDIYGFENMAGGEIDFTIGLNNSVRYICREGWQTYRCMTRMGLRYAILSIRGATSPVLIRDFHITHSTYSVSNAGSFECDSPLLSQIWKMCRHTHELCIEDTFTDSPTYEQAFWLGDAQTSAAVNAAIFGDYPFVRHNLVLGATALQNSPLMNALTPTDWNTSIPLWTMNWLTAIIQYVETTGDQSVVKELYGSICAVLNWYGSLVTQDGGFLVDAWNFVDWAPLDLPSPCVVTAYQGILAYCFENVSRFASELGEEPDALAFRSLAERLKVYLDTTLWDAEHSRFYDGWSPQKGYSKTVSIQTHGLLTLYGAITDPEKRQIVNRYLAAQPEEFIPAGSPFMLFYIYEAWASVGRLADIFEDLGRRWGEMIRYESTTCWEVFPGFYENSRTRSYCHSWSTAPASLMQKYLLGFRRESEGYRSVSFTLPETSLRWCRGSIPTPFGELYADWNRDTGELLLRVPEEISFTLNAPKGFAVKTQRTK